MPTPPRLIALFAVPLLMASASAGSLLYVVTGNQQFGTVDTTTGAFNQIGGLTPGGQAGLVQGPNGSLLSLTFSGNLESINPANGTASVIGATGLGGLANDLAEVGSTVYATDLNNDLYTVNTATGAATMIGPTGIPAVPSSSSVFFDESLYGVGSMLYATFDAYTMNSATLQITPVIAPELYQIDPSTGIATPVASTTLQILASVDTNGAFYVFTGMIVNGPSGPVQVSSLATLNVANGNTAFLTNVNAAAGGVLGAFPAAPVANPEPASIMLAAVGSIVIAAGRRRRRS